MALKTIPGIGNILCVSLIEQFGSPEAVFSKSIHALCSVSGMDKKSAEAIANFRSWDQVSRHLEIMNKNDIQIVTYQDDLYPSNLQNIFDRPVLLYVRGCLKTKDIPFAVIGSRRASTYGRYTTERISRELALQGVSIVSGMARGIDSSAHQGALSASGRTIAVMGNGLDVIYPPENNNLFFDVIQHGAVISEYPPGMPPLPHHFPARNRIISGMSYGVLVVEAGEKSGSLITARLAMEQGRDVFAIPGAIDSAFSRGTNSLIKQGAKLVECIDDILEDIVPQVDHLNPRKTEGRDNTLTSRTTDDKDVAGTLSGTDRMITGILTKEKAHVDDIIAETNLGPQVVMSSLIILELQGIIEQHPGKYFSLKK